MPKRTHRQIRLDTMAEVRTSDAIRAQAKTGKDRYSVVIKPKEKPLRREKKKVCCLDKYGDNLPTHFRVCPDCYREPVLTETQEST